MRTFRNVSVFVAIVTLAGCVEGGEGQEEGISSDESALTTEDGLAEAYGIFQQTFVQERRDVDFRIGFGRNPALETEVVAIGGVAASGGVTIGFGDGHIRAQLNHVPDAASFDLWFVKNNPGTGKSIKPETGDTMVKVGTFTNNSSNFKLLDVVAPATTLHFDLDLVVITRKDKNPKTSVVATGARTLFEKRFFRERDGLPMDAVTGALSDTTETTDPLVRRGAKLFFEETFGGNGRTCGTCHRLENNLTIDANFIARLPQSDPLFVAETNPALAGLEDPALMRRFGVIRENLDGMEAPTTKFVMRGTPHTLAMSTSISDGTGALQPFDEGDSRTGWSGDGSPGRGTLNEFVIGAIVQHFPKTLNRRFGSDFRLPTQDEVDAIEAFQLFSGRQHNPRTQILTFADAAANTGRDKFLNEAFCVACHRDLIGDPNHTQFNFNTNTESFSRSLGFPIDGGFGAVGSLETGFGGGRFNVPPLTEAADTGPFFHNGLIEGLEDAITFYISPNFVASPAHAVFGTPGIDDTGVQQIGAFLRTINAAENIRQSKKRVAFVQANRGPGNTFILQVAIKDLQDAINDLEPKGLGMIPGASAVQALKTAKQTLEIAVANADDARPAFCSNALVWLGIAKGDLIPGNPGGEF
jgi:cytochrome c peroxidase